MTWAWLVAASAAASELAAGAQAVRFGHVVSVINSDTNAATAATSNVITIAKAMAMRWSDDCAGGGNELGAGAAGWLVMATGPGCGWVMTPGGPAALDVATGAGAKAGETTSWAPGIS